VWHMVCRWDWTSRAGVFLSFITLLGIREMFRGNIPNMFSAGSLLARFPGGHRANSLMSVRRPENVEARCGGG